MASSQAKYGCVRNAGLIIAIAFTAMCFLAGFNRRLDVIQLQYSDAAASETASSHLNLDAVAAQVVSSETATIPEDAVKSSATLNVNDTANDGCIQKVALEARQPDQGPAPSTEFAISSISKTHNVEGNSEGSGITPSCEKKLLENLNLFDSLLAFKLEKLQQVKWNTIAQVALDVRGDYWLAARSVSQMYGEHMANTPLLQRSGPCGAGGADVLPSAGVAGKELGSPDTSCIWHGFPPLADDIMRQLNSDEQYIVKEIQKRAQHLLEDIVALTSVKRLTHDFRHKLWLSMGELHQIRKHMLCYLPHSSLKREGSNNDCSRFHVPSTEAERVQLHEALQRQQCVLLRSQIVAAQYVIETLSQPELLLTLSRQGADLLSAASHTRAQLLELVSSDISFCGQFPASFEDQITRHVINIRKSPLSPRLSTAVNTLEEKQNFSFIPGISTRSLGEVILGRRHKRSNFFRRRIPGRTPVKLLSNITNNFTSTGELDIPECGDTRLTCRCSKRVAPQEKRQAEEILTEYECFTPVQCIPIEKEACQLECEEARLSTVTREQGTRDREWVGQVYVPPKSPPVVHVQERSSMVPCEYVKLVRKTTTRIPKQSTDFYTVPRKRTTPISTVQQAAQKEKTAVLECTKLALEGYDLREDECLAPCEYFSSRKAQREADMGNVTCECVEELIEPCQTVVKRRETCVVPCTCEVREIWGSPHQLQKLVDPLLYKKTIQRQSTHFGVEEHTFPKFTDLKKAETILKCQEVQSPSIRHGLYSMNQHSERGWHRAPQYWRKNGC